ncbi:MAG: ABC transporter ATP-binding protein [Saprospiraceae bacterium]
MTSIHLDDVSKRYGYIWGVKNVSFSAHTGTILGISGRNGSGKSTIIKLISGLHSPTSGIITIKVDEKVISTQHYYKYFGLCTPYVDLIQEFTLREQFDFHNCFKSLKVTFKEFDDIIQIGKIQHDKKISEYSSGMKQRIMLALTLLSDVPIVLLDEPTSYLDLQAKSWFKLLLNQSMNEKIIIIASNDTFDLELCQYIYHIV